MRRLALIAVTAVVGLPGALSAQESVFNLPLFGVPEDGATIRMRALGGAGSGAGGEVFSLANPAALGRFRRAGLYLSVLGQDVTVDGPDASGEFSDVLFPMGQIVVPAWGATALALGYYQFVDFDSHLEATVEFEGDTLPVELESTGGVSVLAPAVAWSIDAATQVGASLDIYLGSREIVRVVDLGNLSPGSLASSDSLARNFRGTGFTVGVERTLGPRLRLSAGYRFRPELESDVTRAPGDDPATTTSRFDLPDEISAGATWQATRGVVATAVVRRATWSSFEPVGLENVGFGDALEVGAGIEYSPAARRALLFGPQAPIRAGYRWRRLPLEIDGEAVTEWTGSLGYGRALGSAGRSGLDLVLEYGRRGSLEDHGLEESFLRLGVGFRALEQWRRDRPDS
ncbi:MAG TPA: hypothetical protein VMR66_05940 [Gemmatimonadota bacterium]|nr:hypothetical protein [Gemmatimonadota bacterium]